MLLSFVDNKLTIHDTEGLIISLQKKIDPKRQITNYFGQSNKKKKRDVFEKENELVTKKTKESHQVLIYVVGEDPGLWMCIMCDKTHFDTLGITYIEIETLKNDVVESKLKCFDKDGNVANEWTEIELKDAIRMQQAKKCTVLFWANCY